ncbi:MAG: hypothetical protein ACSHYB_02865 [Roseibacillus sp.]
MRIELLLLCFIVSSCEKQSPEPSNEVVSVAKHKTLAPEDLNIQKQRFTARPNQNQVAIFRTENSSTIKPFRNRTYDQIMWANGDEVHKDVLIADRSFYVDFPEPENQTSENLFRRSWRLWAGGYNYDIDDYAFVRSSWKSSTTEATGEVVYTKKSKTMSEDLVLNFRMFIVSLDEAKKLHPELDIERDEDTTSWEAAYFFEENE